MKKTLHIEGMTCGNCVKHTTEALEKLDGVTSVNVDLAAKSAVVEADKDITDDVFKEAVSEAGYTVTSVN